MSTDRPMTTDTKSLALRVADNLTDEARAALPARAPEGFVLVPCEPTPEMEDERPRL